MPFSGRRLCTRSIHRPPRSVSATRFSSFASHSVSKRPIWLVEAASFVAARPPSLERENPNVGWLYPDPVAAAKDYYNRTGVFPIMHLVGVRKTLVEKHPWLPVAVMKAFEQSKKIAMDALADTSATKVTLPFIEESVKAARELMGEDYWPYGLEANRKTLETFLLHHHAQGLSSRLVRPEELFHPSTHETFKV